MKEIKNFLAVEDFKKLKDLILDVDFPWRIRKFMTDIDNNIYFTHSFFYNHLINSNFFDEFIVPILKKLNCKSPVEIRANMFLNKLFEKSGWHVDHEILKKEMNEHTTAILYLNTCNGGTEFKIKEKVKFIKAEENKIVIFSSKIFHRAVTSTDVDERYIINFNYI